MAHKRKLIRGAAKNMLSNLDKTGARVYTSRVYPLESDNIPGLLIYTTEEESDLLSQGGSLQRFLTLTVEGYVKNTGRIDDDCDEIAEDVEDAIAADRTLDENAVFTYLESTEIIFDAETDKPVGIIKMNFKVEYHTI